MKNKVFSKLIKYSLLEWDVVKSKAQKCSMKTGTYIRYISVYGEIRLYDKAHGDKMVVAINRVGTLVNQIATVCNSTNEVTKGDIARIQAEVSEIKELAMEYLSKLDYKIL